MSSISAPIGVRAPSSSSRFDELVAVTPPTRDRTVDFLRAFSILVVVLWHWVFSVTHWTAGGTLTMPNPIATVPGLWLATWVLQIMPLFFFIGGFANYVAWNANERKRGSVGGFLTARLRRLVTPIAALIVTWTVIDVTLRSAMPGYTGVLHWGFVVFVPLWFLGVYGAVVCLAPLTLRLHQRAPGRALLGVGLAVATIDVLRFTLRSDVLGFTNGLLVFVFVHQLGYFYGDGTLTRSSRRVHWAITLGSVGALALLTSLAAYPRSMVAMQGEPISNMFPPTACIAVLGSFQAGLALLLRPSLNRWLDRPGPWKAVIAANSVSMTLFTWHMTAYVMAVGVVDLLGGRLLAHPTAEWWAQRPLWLFLPGVFLAGLIAVFARFELASPHRPARCAGAALQTAGRRNR